MPEKCEKGYWNEEACDCFLRIKCRKGCGKGKGLDPRYACKCVDQSVIDELYQCKPEPEPEIISCDFGLHHNPKPPAEPTCALTKDDCPNENFTVDKKKCECVCNLYCIATMSVDTETCTCKPIDFSPAPPSEDFTCDSEGTKQCLDKNP